MSMQDQIKTQLAELVAMPSVSAIDPAHDMSNIAVVERLHEWFSDLGLDCRREPVSTTPEKQNMIGRIGAGSGGLILSGHTDTVPFDRQRWESDPFKLDERDGCWFGLGSADMKVFFPCVIAALNGIDRSSFKQPLIVLATADEESTLAGVRKLVENNECLGQFAVIGEPTQLIPIHKHKGIVVGRIRVIGRSGHSSDPALGANALDAMHDVISALKTWRRQAADQYRDASFKVPYPTLNLGAIQGGDSPNRICAECELLFDIRIMPQMDIDECFAEIRSMVEETVAEYGVTATCDMPILPMPAMETKPSSRLVTALEELSGNAAQTVAFGTEGPFLNEMGCESVIFGPGNIATAHQPNEHVEIERTMHMVDILRTLIQRFCCDVE
ncbi:MAG: acetylornithine deacetylase [Gammaproteobacteria bacterium]